MSPIESVDHEQQQVQDRALENELQGKKQPMKYTVAAYNEDTILTGKHLLVVFIAM